MCQIIIAPPSPTEEAANARTGVVKRQGLYLHSTASACPTVALCREQCMQQQQPKLAVEDRQRGAPQHSRHGSEASACAPGHSAVVVCPVLPLQKQTTNSDLHVTAVLGKTYLCVVGAAAGGWFLWGFFCLFWRKKF